MSAKPLPRITAVNRPFWEACNEEVLLLQRCTAAGCGRAIFYPRVCCPHCGDGAPEWVESKGQGRVVTFTLVQRPHHDSFYAEAPFIFAAIELDEGVLLYSRLEAPPDDTDRLIGSRVEVVYRDLGPSQKAPYFRCVG
jgi:hypothetical protein